MLKDASATAIYGSRGANGVILVTTKKGAHDGGFIRRTAVDAYYGKQTPLKIIQMMNLKQYVKILHEGRRTAANGQDTSLAKAEASSRTEATGRRSTRTSRPTGMRAVLRDGMQKSIQGGLVGRAATPAIR